MPSAPAIGFDYRPSRLFPRVALGGGALALLAVGLSGLPWWLKLPCALLAVLATVRALRTATRLPVRAVGWSADGRWTLHLAGGEEVAATLASQRVLGELIVLRLRLPSHGELALLLGPDNSDADLRRRLRMRLAAAGRPGADAAGRGRRG
ncbi:hypothetical protein [Aerosticca soli]|jgi:toxin CptA|uniref:Toxin CptA n=1 Tax=Aerosticca soli TaxID=2010829 RepID=A0A2Z6E654_9GAMM|nr:hypothetical protein [Aerosticca soli]MDI3261276.1 hypothetical protein [Fulvimonas sp.]BBD80553.1 hypothetical protein ALSL_1906 [Aerosticca soli]